MLPMRDRIRWYLDYIDTVWPSEFPGLTIEYGQESYGPLSIYVIVKYGDFCIKRIFNVDDMANNSDAALEYIKSVMQKTRDEVIEKGERNSIAAIKNYCRNDVMATRAIWSTILAQSNKNVMPKPKKIILNDPATIILWSDNTKTIVKKNSKDKKFDPEKGIALCYMKKALGNKGNYNNVFKEWIK